MRPCERGDMRAVAELYAKAFHKTSMASSTGLPIYLGELHLDNPWYDPENPPLVAESTGQRIVGFIGTVPMPMRMCGRPIRSVVGGNFMVDREHSDPLVAARLLKTFLSAPHDIALTDTASQVAIRMWQGFGGELAQYQSMRWVLPLKPLSLGVSFAGRSRVARVASAGAPVARAIDRLVTRRRRTRSGEVGAPTVRPADATLVHDFVSQLDDSSRLQFAGTSEEFGWLAAMASRKTQFGPLRTIAVHGTHADTIGVVMYYPNRRGLGQVALAAATAGNHASMLSALRQDAIEQGSAGLMGQADRQLAFALSNLPSVYVFRNDFVMLHAREAGLIAPLRTGEVALGRLSGEWWTRTQGDSFD
ncbi:MAG: hypothetical protein ABI894_17640 [Ilumatobacteraceae bacterium]